MHELWFVVLGSLGIGLAAGYLGGSINASVQRRAIRELRLDVEQISGDLVRACKKWGAQSRWDRDSEEKEQPTEQQLDFLKDMVVGEERQGFTRGREGGVFRGAR
jgi:hypothetical protein